MHPYLVNIRVSVPDGTSKVVQALISARNPADAMLMLGTLYGHDSVVSVPVPMPH